MFFIEFILFRNCNQTCPYCTTYDNSKKIEIDFDFLESLPITKNMFVELTGGEVGLYNDLPKIVDTVFKKCGKLRIMSNGLVRKKFPEIINNSNIIYCEHLFETPFKKFYNLEPFSENSSQNINVVVVTEEVIDNFEKFEHLVHKNTWFKMVNFKGGSIEKDAKKFIDFYKSIEGKTYIDINYDLFNIMEKDLEMCALNPPTPFISLQDKKIGHCAKILNESKFTDYTEENFIKLQRCELFSYETYCQKCDDPSLHNRIQNMLKSKKGKCVNT